MLATVCCSNGIIFHLFFHFYYVDEFAAFGSRFWPLYIVSCFFLYIDLAMECALGFCDCLLLITQHQLERLMWLAQDLNQTSKNRDWVFRIYVALYNRIVYVLRNCLSRYFGPMLVVFCTYVSLEVALCVLAIVGDTTSFLGRSKVFILANILWPRKDKQNANLLKTHLKQRAGIVEERVRRLCSIYDRTFTLIAKPFYEYCGPIIVIFCPLIILEGSLKIYHLYYLYKTNEFDLAWTLLLLHTVEWLWLCFDCKKLLVVLYVSDTLKRKDWKDARIYGTVRTPVHVGHVWNLKVSMKTKDSFLHIHLTTCIYLALDLSLEWTLGLCCLIMLIGAEQLSNMNKLLLKTVNERVTALEQILPHFCNIYGRVGTDVCKGLSAYFGPLVVCFTAMLVLQCAVKMVDIWGAFSDGGGGRLVLALGCLWLMFDIKKFVVLMLVSHWNVVVCVCVGLFFAGFVWYDFAMIQKLYINISTVLVVILALNVLAYDLLIYCIILNALYHRKWFVRLLNHLFAYDDWKLEQIVVEKTRKNSMHSGNLVRMIVLVLLYALYDILFVDDYAIVLMDTIITLRFCFAFLFLELYRACALIIKRRMKQLELLLRTVLTGNNLMHVESYVDLFLERFQRYNELIDDVNKCFCFPLTHVLLLIVFEQTVTAYDAYHNLMTMSNMQSRHFYGFIYRQVWEIAFVIMLLQFAVTCDAAILQVFFLDLPPFAMGVVLFEMLLSASVPLCIVLNNFCHRKRVTKLLNAIFFDDNLLDSTSVRLGNAYYVYIFVLLALIMLFEIFKLFAKEAETHKMLTTSFVIRFVTVLQFLYLFHLCVSMVGLRMQQLKVLFEQTQHEDDFDYFLGLFITRFERYVLQIDQINRCFALPIIATLALGMVELSLFVFECFYTLDAGLPDREMYDGFDDWILSQLWQALYCNFLLLTVSSCESTRKKIVFVLNTFYRQTTYVHLLNALFAQDDWVLEWTMIKRKAVTNDPPTRHNNSLGVLALFTLPKILYIIIFNAIPSISILYCLTLLRFCCMFMMVELYRACVIVIKDRMKQLQTLLMLTQNDNNVPIFLERFQRYHQLIDSVNQCFSIPLWQMIYVAVIFMIGITGSLASIQHYLIETIISQVLFHSGKRNYFAYIIPLVILVVSEMSASVRRNRFTFRFLAAVYFLPASYDPVQSRFVELRSSFVSFGIGLLISLAYIYHDVFFVLFYNSTNLSTLSLIVFILELIVFCLIPLCAVCNSFIHRKLIVIVLNVLFVDDSTLEVGSGAFTLVTRYLLTTQFLYVYHLCVSMIQLRMKQLKVLFLQNQHELEFAQLLNVFMERFQRYVAQIERINQCFSLPLLGMILQVLIESAYFTYEGFRVLSTRQVVDTNYTSIQQWLISQFWQANYANFLLLMVPSCEQTCNEFAQRHADIKNRGQ
uniref:Gustatory receptor n=1 Tax=Anopheles culicifacies TaxID=139723 RepID=A0A182M3I8_9DIPT